jgi:GNAT superfamily N-acetyltransferase
VRSAQQHGGAPVTLLSGAGYSARVRPWPTAPTTAHLVLMDQRSAPPSSILRSWLNQLHDGGFQHVRTGAVHDEQRSPFTALGFESAQELVLLHRAMNGNARPWRLRNPPVRLARPDDLARLAELDSAAFPIGWGLDTVAITDAATATPRHRIAVVDDAQRRPVAYSISGRAGQAAFLQRLAVDPAAQGSGLGRLLVDDCLRWVTRWKVHTVAVNTQSDNDRALRLYESFGFVRRQHGLTVMQRSLDGAM